jgi:hypothetical protein
VAIFRADGSVLSPGLFAFPGFSGTIGVAAGDVTGDGTTDVVVSAGPGVPGGAVSVFRGVDLVPVCTFVPYAPTVTNGVIVQLADSNLDGVLDLQVTLQGGGNPGLVAFNGATGRLLALSTGGQGTNDSSSNADGGDSGAGNFIPNPPPPSTVVDVPVIPPAPNTGCGDSGDVTDTSSGDVTDCGPGPSADCGDSDDPTTF